MTSMDDKSESDRDGERKEEKLQDIKGRDKCMYGQHCVYIIE